MAGFKPFASINTSLCVKDDEMYVFVFDEANRENAARQIAHFANDPELSLNWFDAATMIRQIHEQTPQPHGTNHDI